MANRFPLILNTTDSTIQELPSGDNLDLSGSNISNVGNITGTSINASMNANNLTSGTISSTILGNSTLNIGTTSIALNRSSGSQSLTGITSIDGSASTVTTNAQPNITSTGTLTSLTVSGNVAITGANVSLGAVGNVKITGGSTNQLIKTDGAGNLSFTTISGDSYKLKPVRVSTNASGNVALTGTYAIDGVMVAVGDRVLVMNQSDATQNGIYVVASGAWTRATDFDTGAATLIGGITVTVLQGLYLTGVEYVCTNTTAITIGSTGITFVRTIGSTGFISIWTVPGAYSEPAVGSAFSGATAMGVRANAGVDGVAIGFQSIGTLGQSTAIGYSASAINQSVAIGAGAVAGASNFTQSVSIGRSAVTYERGTAIGYGTKSGDNGVAIGYQSGSNIGQTVNVGQNTGRFTQGSRAISVGSDAGTTSQGAKAVAFGSYAGYTGQGANAIAIGANSGYTNQASNSIILNATGANLDMTTANTFTVKPVRAVTDVTGLKQLYYNPTTGEIVFYNV